MIRLGGILLPVLSRPLGLSFPSCLDPRFTSARMAAATPPLTERTFDLLDALHRIGDQLGAPVAAVALAWVRQQAGVTSSIIGARTVERLESNLSSLEVTIPDQQLAELDKPTEPQLEFPADILTAMERDNL